MRLYKNVPETVRSRRQDTKIICDRCSEPLNTRGYQFDEIELKAFIGPIFPEDDMRDALAINSCAACFHKFVRPTLEAVGFRFRTWSMSYEDEPREEDPDK